MNRYQYIDDKKTAIARKRSHCSSVQRVLLMGYNGANNTGSEARLLTIIDEVRSVLGEAVIITIPTMNRANLSRYITETKTLRIVEFPTVYLNALYHLVCDNDLILLVEGSCYMDTWSTFLLWAWLWVTWVADKKGKPVVAYAIDCGHLSKMNQYLVTKVASKTTLIITRTRKSALQMKKWKVKSPIIATADCAFCFEPLGYENTQLHHIWPEAKDGVIGIAPVDYYLWPVVIRLFGRTDRCYRWPFYYSDSSTRRKAKDILARNYAGFADRLIEKYKKPIAFFCMEQLDEPIVKAIQGYMRHDNMTRIISSGKYNAFQMTTCLRSLDLLITSRYHAAVLSLKELVPQIAVGHDKRLKHLYQELKMYPHYFVDSVSVDLFGQLEQLVSSLLNNPQAQRRTLIKHGHVQAKRARRNQVILRRLLEREV